MSLRNTVCGKKKNKKKLGCKLCGTIEKIMSCHVFLSYCVPVERKCCLPRMLPRRWLSPQASPQSPIQARGNVNIFGLVQVDDSGQPGEQSRLPAIKVTPPSEASLSKQRDSREGDSQSTERLTDGTSEKAISQTSGGVANGILAECETSEVSCAEIAPPSLSQLL